MVLQQNLLKNHKNMAKSSANTGKKRGVLRHLLAAGVTGFVASTKRPIESSLKRLFRWRLFGEGVWVESPDCLAAKYSPSSPVNERFSSVDQRSGKPPQDPVEVRRRGSQYGIDRVAGQSGQEAPIHSMIVL